jgi:hypothetical protein
MRRKTSPPGNSHSQFNSVQFDSKTKQKHNKKKIQEEKKKKKKKRQTIKKLWSNTYYKKINKYQIPNPIPSSKFPKPRFFLSFISLESTGHWSKSKTRQIQFPTTSSSAHPFNPCPCPCAFPFIPPIPSPPAYPAYPPALNPPIPFPSCPEKLAWY